MHSGSCVCATVSKDENRPDVISFRTRLTTLSLHTISAMPSPGRAEWTILVHVLQPSQGCIVLSNGSPVVCGICASRTALTLTDSESHSARAAAAVASSALSTCHPISRRFLKSAPYRASRCHPAVHTYGCIILRLPLCLGRADLRIQIHEATAALSHTS